VTCLLDSHDGVARPGTDKNSPPQPILDPIVRMCWMENLVPPEKRDPELCLRDSNAGPEPTGCGMTA
jgi:hypothetical protein